MIFRAAAVIASVLAFASGALADWTVVEERFYALTLAGEPCGRSSERIERDGTKLRTTSRIEMRFTRLGQETVIDLASGFTETDRGEPIEATVEQKGAQRIRYDFTDPTRVVVERGAARTVRELTTTDWLTPREVAAFVAARHAASAAEIRFRTLDVQSGLVLADVSMTRGGTESVSRGARSLELTRYAVTNSLIPVVADERYDAAGVLIVSTTPIGLGELVSTLATKAEADDSYARASFDLLAGTFIASKPIVGFESRAALRFSVRAKGARLIDLPSVGAQTFVRIDARQGTIEIDTMRGSGAAVGDATDTRWLRPNELIDADEPAVLELLATAKFAPGAGPLSKAVTLRALVYRHLRVKNLATAFGSASEAAKSRSGDCTEHAVLLAALLRAVGIPSRVASGLVYVPELGGNPAAKGPGWGWHLWTQALVEPPIVAGGGGSAWVDFDATVGGAARFHAAHVLVATSELSGGATDPAFATALSLIGAVEIEEIAPERSASDSDKGQK